MSTGAIARHKNGCMKETIQEHEIVQATDLQKWTTRIRDDLERIGDKAEQAGIYGPAVSARRAEMELIKTMGLQAEPEKTDDDGLMKALDEATAAVWEDDGL